MLPPFGPTFDLLVNQVVSRANSKIFLVLSNAHIRLTLVKEHNMAEIQAYAELIVRGVPDLIEVKGVTFCGDTATR